MPRSARKTSSTGIYHVMIRGINRSPIYYDEVDRDKFMDFLKTVKEETIFLLYSYSLMGNHAHFLLKENEISISEIMKKLCGIYGAWFNFRHNRVGHLFQDRFKSECVETNAYFVTVLKYILNNPVKANIVEKAEDYKWSSCHEYLGENSITDTDYFLNLLDGNPEKAKGYFIEELKKESRSLVYLTADNIRRTDVEAKEIVRSEMEISGIESIPEITIQQRIYFIKSLKTKGLTIRQIMDGTGLPISKIIGI